MKEIIGIGFNIPSHNEDFARLDSFSSLADADVAIFCPDFSTTSYSTSESYSYNSGTYEGKPLYNKESSALILDHAKHWRKELLYFVENGGTLFIVLSKKSDFYIYDGTKNISGTGRNQKTTHHVTPFTNYQYLPFSNIDFHTATGKNIIPKTALCSDFYKQFKDIMSFEVYIRTQNTGMEIFTTKNGDRNLGSIYSYSKGYVIFLPSFNFGHEDFAEYNEKEDEETWTKEALKKGNILINFLIETTKMLNTSSQKTPKPNWLNDASFELEQSLHTKQEIQKIEKEIEEKKKLLTNLNSVLEEKEILKDLLYETGKPLEKAVIKALKILGFSAENYDDGQLELDQIILSPEGKRFIGECEGKDNKDIDVTKFRQLLDGLNADFERDDVAEKAYGLLLGNSQRLTNPNERTLDFTQKCQNGAKREKIGLIKTTDLFTICKVIEETKDLEFAKKCREAIYRQMGEIIKFPAYKSPISKRV